MWQFTVAYAVLSLALCGLVVLSVRRYNRRVAAIEAALATEHAAFRADLRAQVDTAIAGMDVGGATARAVGSFVTRKATGPAIEVDCSNWGREAVGHLELIVAANTDVTEATIRHHTQRISDEIVALDPALHLTYELDGLRRVNGDYRVLLTPLIYPADADRRLARVCETANRLLAEQMQDVPTFRLESRRKAG